MRTALALVGFVLLFSAVAVAESPAVTEGQLEIVGKGGASRGLCPLEHTDIRAEVSGFLTRVTVTQRFVNPFDEPIEAVYLFPLSGDAAVDRMTMVVGDRHIRGEVKRRDEARATYEAARAEGRVASLLEQQRPNVFTQSVANILPRATVEVEISYVETLRYEGGAYRFVFPMVVERRYTPGTMKAEDAARIDPPMVGKGMRAGHGVSLSVALDAGVPVTDLRSTLHEVDVERTSARSAVVTLRNKDEIPNRDFVLTYDVAGAKIEDAVLTHRDERGGFFTMILQPPDRVAAEDVMPREIVFVVDTSGSMSGFPLEKARECIDMALGGLYPDDTFNLITFAGDTRILFDEPARATRQNLSKAKKFLDDYDDSGGTEMMAAIRAALEPTDRQDHVRIVCFMTDGQVGNDTEIIGEVRKHPNARVFSFGIGNSVNRFLLDKMAEEGRGEVEYVTLSDDGSAAARRFYERIRSPLLVDVEIDWGGLAVTDVEPARIPDLFSAKPVVVTGRYTAPGSGVVRLRGRASGREVVREIAVALPDAEARNDVLATLWARRRVDALMRQEIDSRAAGGYTDAFAEAIAEIGVTYRLMTQYTSFVAVDDRPVTAGGDPRRVDVATDVPDGVDASAIGGMGETVTVMAGAEMVSTSSSVLSTVVTERQLANLPAISRNPYALVQMSGTAVAINGQRSASTNVLLDGADSNDAAAGVPPDAIAEYSVATSGYTAEFGRTGTGVVNVTTKAGTNDFHGSVYEMNRTSAVASQPFAEKAVVAPAPVPEGVFTRNQFGLSLGGPIVRDRLFFFGAVEWLRIRGTRNMPFLVPTPELLAASSPATRALFADYSLRPGLDARTVRVGDVPFAGAGPLAALGDAFPAFTQRYVPVAGDTGAGAPGNAAQGTVRVDWNANDRTTVMARYGFDRTTLFAGALGASPYAGFDTGSESGADAAHVSVTRVFADDLVGVATIAVDRRDDRRPLGENAAGTALHLLPRPFVPLGDATAPVALPGYQPLSPGDGVPWAGPRTHLRVAGDATWSVGNHSIKFGGSWASLFDGRESGAYRYPIASLGRTPSAALDNLILGRAFRIDTPLGAPASYERDARVDDIGVFASDSWRVRPRITLTLGVRYDVFGVPRDADPRRDSNFYLGPGATLAERIGAGRVVEAAAGPTGGLFASDLDNVAPRVGVAWDVFGNGQTSIRGGYGVVFERLAGEALFATIQNPPNLTVAQVRDAGLGGAAPSTSPAPPLVRAIDERLVAPYVHFWMASLQRELSGLVASIDYAGATGVRLASVDNVNANRLNPLYGDVFQLRNSGSSSSNSLTLGVESRRLDPVGVQFTARYTWAHAIDTVTTEGPVYGFSPGLLDAFDASLDRGDSDTDVRHRFVAHGVWDIPFADGARGWRRRLFDGWSATWLFDARTGTPFTIFDCANAVGNCERVVAVAGLDGDLRARPLAGATVGNRYVLVDLTGPVSVGRTGRNAFRGPGAWNLDGGVMRTIAFNERVSLELRVEALNVFNHANLAVSRGEADLGSSTYVPAYFDGRRQLQFGARLSF